MKPDFITGFTILTLIVVSISGCSSKKVTKQKYRDRVEDHRGFMLKADTWEPQYISCDTGCGIKLEFYSKTYEESKSPFQKRIILAPGPARNKLTRVNLYLWKYPIDTVVNIVTKRQMVESFAITEDSINVTTIDYDIRTVPLVFNAKVDSTKPLFLKVPPGTYFLSFGASDFRNVTLKDVIIKDSAWSVTKIDTMRKPPPLTY